MNQKLLKGLPHGIYRLYWTAGGSSVASVGQDDEGDYWFAPTNWIAVPSFDWRNVEQLLLITVQNLERLDDCRKEARQVSKRIARYNRKRKRKS